MAQQHYGQQHFPNYGSQQQYGGMSTAHWMAGKTNNYAYGQQSYSYSSFNVHQRDASV